MHTESSELRAILKEVWSGKFDYNVPIPPRPDYILEIVEKEHHYGIALPGSIIEVSGLSKTRKSSLISMFVSAALSQSRQALKVVSGVEGAIVWFDTEQNDTEFKMFQKKVHTLAELRDNHPNYYAYNIRKYDELIRLDIVEATLERIYSKHQHIGLIVVDGVADLLYNSNEQEPAKKLVTQLASWADNYRAAIFTAIHTNKDGKHSTGALGGFLDKKCSYHIRTEQEEYIGSATTVYTQMSRSGEAFPPFKFTHDADGLPSLDSEYAIFGEDDSSELSAKEVLSKKDSLLF